MDSPANLPRAPKKPGKSAKFARAKPEKPQQYGGDSQGFKTTVRRGLGETGR